MKNKYLKFLIIPIAFTINIVLLRSYGTQDVGVWKWLLITVFNNPIPQIIQSCMSYHCPVYYPPDYPPGFFIYFLVFGKILPIRLIGGFAAAKIMIFIFYCTSLILLILFNKFLDRKKRGIRIQTADLIILYLSSVSLVLNAQGLGYTDIFLFPPLILMIFSLIKRKIFLSGLFYGISIQTKWQPVLLLPVIIIYLYKSGQQKNLFRIILTFLLGILVVFLSLLPFNRNIFVQSYHSLFFEAGRDEFYSATLNFLWVLSYFSQLGRGIAVPLSVNRGELPVYFAIHKIVFIALYFVLLLNYLRVKLSYSKSVSYFLITSLVIYLIYFLFSSGVHENHFMIAVFLSIILYIINPDKKAYTLFLFADIVNFINMLIFYGLTGTPLINRMIMGFDISVVIAAAFSVLGFGIIQKYFFHSSNTNLHNKKRFH